MPDTGVKGVMAQMIRATTLSEIAAARKAQLTWQKAHPADRRVLASAGSQLTMLERLQAGNTKLSEDELALREYVRDNRGRFADIPGKGLPDHLSDHDAERLTDMGVQTAPLPPNQRQKFALHGEQQYFWPTPGATGPEHGDVMRLVFPESGGYEQAPPDMMWGEYSREPDGTYGISVNKGDFDDPTPTDIARFKRMFPMAKRATFNYAEPRRLTDRLLGRHRPKVIYLQTEEV